MLWIEQGRDGRLSSSPTDWQPSKEPTGSLSCRYGIPVYHASISCQNFISVRVVYQYIIPVYPTSILYQYILYTSISNQYILPVYHTSVPGTIYPYYQYTIPVQVHHKSASIPCRTSIQALLHLPPPFCLLAHYKQSEFFLSPLCFWRAMLSML